MPEVVKYCPLCNHTESRLFDARQLHNHTVTNRLCQNCGFVFQSPRMTETELNEFYAGEYRKLYQGSEGPSRKDLAAQGGRAAALLQFVVDLIPSVACHLDIGCSAGILLETFREHYGSQTVGVEPGDAYREFTKQKGITAFDNLATLTEAGIGFCDLISMGHVLEHLPDPVGYLAELRKSNLSPDGYLLLEVPNLFCHDSFEIAHLSSFSGHTLKETVKQAGFRIEKMVKHGQPRSKTLPLYLTLLARPAQVSKSQGDSAPGVRRESLVSQKRELGLLRRKLIQRFLPGSAWEKQSD